MTKANLLFWRNQCPNSWMCDTCMNNIFPMGLLISDKTDQGDITPTNNTESDHSSIMTDNQLYMSDPHSTEIKNTNISSNKYPKIFFGEHELERVTNIKFLGVILTESLSWTDHMNYIISKVNKNIGYFYKARSILDQKEPVSYTHLTLPTKA